MEGPHDVLAGVMLGLIFSSLSLSDSGDADVLRQGVCVDHVAQLLWKAEEGRVQGVLGSYIDGLHSEEALRYSGKSRVEITGSFLALCVLS
jgi:hypothetical protein